MPVTHLTTYTYHEKREAIKNDKIDESSKIERMVIQLTLQHCIDLMLIGVEYIQTFGEAQLLKVFST